MICDRCRQDKPESGFYPSRLARGIHQCKACINADQYDWRKRNPEKSLAARKRWRIRHREDNLRKAKEWRANNPDKVRAQHRRNREKHKAHLTLWNRDYKRRIRLLVLAHYSGGFMACSCCGEGTIEFLTIDHIAGGGRQHREQSGAHSICLWLKARGFPPGYRVLCMNCNHALGRYGFCPHKIVAAVGVGT